MDKIKHLGFDLDQTLYPKSSKIDNVIQDYIFDKVSKILNISFDNVKDKFNTYYPEISGRKALIKMGFCENEAQEIVQEALENADLKPFLIKDEKVISMLNELKKKYTLTLITGSIRKCCLEKLEVLGIDKGIFDYIITGEVSKSDGTAYLKWIERFGDKPALFLYVGDRKSTDIDVPASLGIKGFLVKDRVLDVLNILRTSN